MDADIYILLGFFINIAAVTSAGIWVFYTKRQMSFLYAKMWNMNNEINRHTISLEMNDMLPLPWEVEEDESPYREKRGDNNTNVIYLHEE